MKRLLFAVLVIFFGTTARAAYPEKPIRFILPSAAGGSVDILMRVLAQQLSTQMGVPFEEIFVSLVSERSRRP